MSLRAFRLLALCPIAILGASVSQGEPGDPMEVATKFMIERNSPIGIALKLAPAYLLLILDHYNMSSSSGSIPALDVEPTTMVLASFMTFDMTLRESTHEHFGHEMTVVTGPNRGNRQDEVLTWQEQHWIAASS
ncbi:hypothetical protein PENSPDRAFT_672461 [Peniophora sp. CONT]|nr:hypothetical protein PENSPDRAFT_672461 [Peniophora sp. CONT]